MSLRMSICAWLLLASRLDIHGYAAQSATAVPPAVSTGEKAAIERQVIGTVTVLREPRVQSRRVYIVMVPDKEDQGQIREPRLNLGEWFGTPQTFAMPVTENQASVTLDDHWLGFPRSLHDMPAGDYVVQAVEKVNLDACHWGKDAGDCYSEPVRVRFEPNSTAAATLAVTKVVQERPVRETDRLKVFEAKSEMLSSFSGRSVQMRASVYLPPSWATQPEKTYPVVYFVTGFGGTHRDIGFSRGMVPREGPEAEVIFVVPDPSCYEGHSVFADSANNGPWGTALVKEFAPALEKQFRGGGAQRRYVTGISSGGWSSLWLQVEYPEDFNGCWSHCPDPVDFHDFQQIDLYASGTNMYMDEHGQKRPIARMGGAPSLFYQDFVAMETVMGPGGQIGSFEAVFSPRGADGKPLEIFDRATGAVFTDRINHWEKYDIRRKIEAEWSARGPKLAGKIRVYAGEIDTFYLEGAARRLKESLGKLGSDAEVTIVPQMAHTIYRAGMKSMFETIAANESSK
jgi:enterochelin esterase-like enzyme